MQVYDAAGKPYELISTGSSGGEGTIYRVSGAPLLAAKIFHPGRVTEELSMKLEAMLRSVPSDASWEARRHRSIIWPLALAYSDQHARGVAGYVMPWIDTSVFKQAHTYYDPADRIRRFGGMYTWRHLLIAACNLSSAVAAVHEQGHRIGDLRDTNILVAPNSLVSIIDCDSFQIVDEDSGHVFPTKVGAGEFLPPELHGADLAAEGIDRYHSDLFALAVMVFKFLMLGVHPSQARGPAMADMPSIEAKIAAGVYAFGGRMKGIAPVAFAPDIKVLPPGLRSLAERAFIKGFDQPEARPSAVEWFDALNAEGPSLKTCRRNPNHLFGGHLRACPWCGMASDPFPPAPNIGGQVSAPQPDVAASIASRSDHLSSYIEMALVDGGLSDEETRHIRRLGAELGLRNSEVDLLIKQTNAKMKRSFQATSPSKARRSGSTAVATRPVRSMEELKALVAAHGKTEEGEDRGPKLHAAARTLSLAAISAAIASIAPLATLLAVVLLVIPAWACSAEVTRQRRASRGWGRIAPKMLTRGPQAVVQSVYHLIPAFMYGAIPLGATYWALIELGNVDADAAGRWFVAAAATGALVWMMLLAAREPYVRAVREGAELAERWIAKSRRSRTVLALVTLSVIAACIYAGEQGHVTWWPLQGSPFD